MVEKTTTRIVNDIATTLTEPSRSGRNVGGNINPKARDPSREIKQLITTVFREFSVFCQENSATLKNTINKKTATKPKDKGASFAATSIGKDKTIKTKQAILTNIFSNSCPNRPSPFLLDPNQPRNFESFKSSIRLIIKQPKIPNKTILLNIHTSKKILGVGADKFCNVFWVSQVP